MRKKGFSKKKKKRKKGLLPGSPWRLSRCPYLILFCLEAGVDFIYDLDESEIKMDYFILFIFYCILALPIIQLIFHLICSLISQLEFLLLMEKHHTRKRIGLLIKITLDHVFPHDHRIRISVTWCHPCSLYLLIYLFMWFFFSLLLSQFIVSCLLFRLPTINKQFSFGLEKIRHCDTFFLI